MCRRIAKVLKEQADGIRPAVVTKTTGVADPSLFEMPPKEECPLCMRVMPILPTMKTYHACCGQAFCSGCLYEDRRVNRKINAENASSGKPPVGRSCPFCRVALFADFEELKQRLDRRIALGDADAMNNLGMYYQYGLVGLPKDEVRAHELFRRAADLGSHYSQCNIGTSYSIGTPLVVRDVAKAKEFWTKAAMGGVVQARTFLGNQEYREGNAALAVKHWRISAAMGCEDSVNKLICCFENGAGCISHEDLAKSLQAKGMMCIEIRSEERDRAFLLMKEEEREFCATHTTSDTKQSSRIVY